MQFNSLEFFIFFCIVVWVFFSTPVRFRWLFLLIASYVFYMAWEPAYALLIASSTVVDYAAGLLMGRAGDRSRRRKYLLMSLGANLGLLFTFKYFNFFSAALGSFFGWLDLPFDSPYLDVLLPVGISFYTFQTLSYAIEVYRGNQEPEKHFGRFALYVSFFPQLVAGPIERPMNLLPQLRLTARFDYERIRSGLALMLWGMFKKVVVADRLAVVVDQVYGTPDRYPGMFLAIATVFFAFQIYCDFSGYSDIAIGTARVLGVDLMRNFNRPYAAESIPDFWRRWHISLSTWFRDYVYVPLGGNRVPASRWFSNIIIVFVVSGLWHGAAWTFIAWGALHGIYYILGHASRGWRQTFARRSGLARLPFARRGLSVACTFALVCVAWVFFRAENLRDAWYILTAIPRGWSDLSVYGGFGRIVASMDISVKALAVTACTIPAVLSFEYLAGTRPPEQFILSQPVWVRWTVYIILCFAIMNLGVIEEIPFVYFQF